MENWRQYVAKVEQEEEPLEEGLGSKILAGLALLAGTAAGSGQAHAGDGVINISPEKTQMLVQAYDDMAVATDDRDPKKNKILRAKADLVKSADDGQITRDEVETWGPASQSIMMQVMQTLNEPSAPETPTASSASDAPTPQTTVTQRQASSGIGELSQFIAASSGDLETKRAKLKQAQDAGATALHGVDISTLDKAAAQVLINKAMGK